MCACTITCGLVAKLVDNPVRENLTTRVGIRIINSSGYLSIEDITEDGAKQSVYKFVLTVTEEISLLCDYKQPCELISVALSMSNPRILFSRILHCDYLEQTVNKPGKKPKDISFNTPGGKFIHLAETIRIKIKEKFNITSSPVEIDEKEFLKTLKGLINLVKITDKTLFERNIVEAVNNYIIASSGNNKEHFYEFLYIALEKAANADGKDRRGDKFDLNVSKLTGINLGEIKNLRLFNRKVKHPFKDEREKDEYQSSLKKAKVLILKKAADTAIKYRIREYESSDIR